MVPTTGDDIDWETFGKKTKAPNGFLKGCTSYAGTAGKNVKIKLGSATSSCKVNVKLPGNKWVVRLDGPHGTHVPFDHININPQISGFKDPHIRLPPGGLAVGRGVAKVCKVVNKVALPVAITLDVISTGRSIYKDSENQTTRNTVETVSSIAGGWTGGFGGAMGGATIGTAILPGIGTIIGSIIGGIAGGIGGSLGTTAVVNTVGDALEYDTTTVKCKECRKEFKIRRYQGESVTTLCEDCSKEKAEQSEDEKKNE